MVYLVQVTIYTGLFWGLYCWLGRDRLSPAVARLFLIVSVSLPLVLPFFAWGWALDTPVSQTIMRHWSGAIPSSAISLDPVTVKPHTPVPWLAAGYGFIALCLLCNKGWMYLRFMRQYMGRAWEPYRSARLYRNTGIGPASFANAIFIPAADVDAAVMAHEYAHVAGRHTADLISLDMLRAAFWPNFFLRAIFRELKVVHEYAADATAARGVPQYSELLLGAVLNSPAPALTNAFAQTCLPRRLRFLACTLRKRGGHARMVAGGVAVIVAIILMQSCQKTATDNRVEIASFFKDLGEFTSKHPNYKGPAVIHSRTVKVNADSNEMNGYFVYANPDVKAVPPAAFNTVIAAEMPGWKKIHPDSVADGQESYLVFFNVMADGSLIPLFGFKRENSPEISFDEKPMDPALARILARSLRWTPARWKGRAVATSTGFALIKK